MVWLVSSKSEHSEKGHSRPIVEGSESSKLDVRAPGLGTERFEEIIRRLGELLFRFGDVEESESIVVTAVAQSRIHD